MSSDFSHHVVSASAAAGLGAAFMHWVPEGVALLGGVLAVIWYTFEIIDNPAFQRLIVKRWFNRQVANVTHNDPSDVLITPMPQAPQAGPSTDKTQS